MEKVRLSKLMSARGICSRREADVYIEQGSVYVDGQPVRELGTKIYPWQEIVLDRAAQIRQNQQVTILLNKPVGYVSGQPEPGYKSAISLVNNDSHFHQDRSSLRFVPQHLKNIAPAGRLDRLTRIVGVYPGWSHCQTIDWRIFANRKGIPGTGKR